MQNRGIGSWLTTRAATTADAVALVYGDGETQTYGELGDRAARWAALFTARGIGRGDRIAFLGENQPAFVEVLFGAARAGIVFVPVNTRLAAPEVAHILADSGAKLLVHDDRCATVATDAAGDLPRIAVGAEADAALAVVEPAPEAAGVGLDDPAAILYTSGTTGRPKGAVLTHGNLTWNSLNTLVDADIVSTDVALVISPLFHAASLGMGLLPVLLKGGTVVLERAFDAGRALRIIEEQGVTMLSGVHRSVESRETHLWRVARADPGARGVRGARAVVLAGLRDDRDVARGDLPARRPHAGEDGVGRSAALLHRGAGRR
jgi:fatty-acyl-CoA synthase